MVPMPGKASGWLGRGWARATVVSYGRPSLPLAVQAADELERDFGYTFDVIDLADASSRMTGP